jgi:hypothetical protein
MSNIVISKRKLEAQISMFFSAIIVTKCDEVNCDELRLIELFTIFLSYLARDMLKSLERRDTKRRGRRDEA